MIPFFDASALKMNDSTPVKVTFLNANGSDHHLIGFYTLDASAFHDMRILFADVNVNSLIPGVSSVFLGNRLNGKTPVFFMVENGYALNVGSDWFADACVGKNGSWRFLAAPERDDVMPALNQGETVWKNNQGEIVENAKDAVRGTPHPILIWQSNDGRLYQIQGNVYHSFGYGLYAALNPDDQRHTALIPEKETAAVKLLFAGKNTTDLLTKPAVALKLQIGERNFSALTRNRVACGLQSGLDSTAEVGALRVEIPDEFDDTLYVEGFEDQKSLPIGGATLAIEAQNNILTVKGISNAAVYEALCGLIKVKTDAASPAKCPVKAIFQTPRGPVVCSGEIEILSENSSAQVLLSGSLGLPASLPPVNTESEKTHKIFSEVFAKPILETVKNDDIPAFLTQADPIKIINKTALITGATGKIGKAVATALAAKGWHVLLHCVTASAEMTHLVEDLHQKYGVKTAYMRADFTNADELKDLLPSLSKTYGTIDAVVNAIAVVEPDTEAEANRVSWIKNSINLTAGITLVQALSAQMPKGREGAFVQIIKEQAEAFSYSLVLNALESFIRQSALPNVRSNAVKNPINVDECVKSVLFMLETTAVANQIVRVKS